MLTRCDLREKAPLLFIASADDDRQHAELLDGDDKGARGARFRDLLDHLHVGEKGAPKSAVFGGDRDAEQIVLREKLFDIPRELAGRVDLGGARRNFFSD